MMLYQSYYSHQWYIYIHICSEWLSQLLVWPLKVFNTIRINISSVVELKLGPRKQNFWPKINILKGNHCILRIRGAPVRQKLSMILENRVVQKLKLEKVWFFTNNGLLNWYSWMIFFLKKFHWFWHRKLTLKVLFRHFLTNHNSLQDCFKTISFQHVYSWAKILHFRTTIFKVPPPNWH